MECKTTEIARDTYRISTFHPSHGIQYNQFLIKDDEPFLMHTGTKSMFQSTLQGVNSIMDASKLRWIGISHFESDESGALNEWLDIAPRAQGVCSFVCSTLNLNDFSSRPPHSLSDGETFKIGQHVLRFISTPHVPHGWDAGLFFDETEKTLFCSDLFAHFGDVEPMTGSEIIQCAKETIQNNPDLLPYTLHTEKILQHLADLKPKILAVMHGSSFSGDGQKVILELNAVFEELCSKPMDTPKEDFFTTLKA